MYVNMFSSAPASLYQLEFRGFDVNMILFAYKEPQRVYHGTDHIVHMLHALNEMRDMYKFDMDSMLKLNIAAWYHDIVYEIGRKDNEHRSAALALMDSGDREVADAILTTKTHRDPSTFWGACLIDADLYGLGTSAYESNRLKVKAEYGNIDEELWVAGRKAFLESYLNRPTLFYTSWGAQYEAPARENMERELDSLE